MREMSLDGRGKRDTAHATRMPPEELAAKNGTTDNYVYTKTVITETRTPNKEGLLSLTGFGKKTRDSEL